MQLPTWVSPIADLASLVSLPVTAFVALEVKKVRRAYLQRIRIPELAVRFDELCTQLSDSLNDFSNDAVPTWRCVSSLAQLAQVISEKVERSKRKPFLDLAKFANGTSQVRDQRFAREVQYLAASALESIRSIERDLSWQA